MRTTPGLSARDGMTVGGGVAAGVGAVAIIPGVYLIPRPYVTKPALAQVARETEASALLGYDRELCAEVVSAFVLELSRSLKRRAKRELGLASVEELVEITPSASAQAPAARARAQTRLPRRRLRKSPPAGGGQVTGWWEQALT